MSNEIKGNEKLPIGDLSGSSLLGY